VFELKRHAIFRHANAHVAVWRVRPLSQLFLSGYDHRWLDRTSKQAEKAYLGLSVKSPPTEAILDIIGLGRLAVFPLFSEKSWYVEHLPLLRFKVYRTKEKGLDAVAVKILYIGKRASAAALASKLARYLDGDLR
jgi:hypothetical protein